MTSLKLVQSASELIGASQSAMQSHLLQGGRLTGGWDRGSLQNDEYSFLPSGGVRPANTLPGSPGSSPRSMGWHEQRAGGSQLSGLSLNFSPVGRQEQMGGGGWLDPKPSPQYSALAAHAMLRPGQYLVQDKEMSDAGNSREREISSLSLSRGSVRAFPWISLALYSGVVWASSLPCL